jgi:type I restriction enzyme, S subunit
MSNYMPKWGELIIDSPKSWWRGPLGELFDERTERNRPDLPLLSVTSAEGVVPRDSIARRDTSNVDKSKYLRVVPGDVVYNTMRMWQGVSSMTTLQGIVSPAYTVCTPRPMLDGQYAEYLLRFPPLVSVFHGHSQGLVDDTLSLNYRTFSRINVVLPPRSEQQNIVKVLNTVDSAIQLTRRVSAQTRTVKEELLRHLLTCGIGHTVFKKTEIGEIPAAWEVRPVGSVLEQVRRPVNVLPEMTYREVGVRSHGKGIFHKEPVTGKSLGSKRVFHIVPDCLIINIVFAWEGAVTFTSESEIGMIASHRFPLWRPRPHEADLHYLVHYLQSKKGIAALRSVSPGGAGRNKTMNQRDFLRLLIAVPPIEEQHRIADAVQAISSAVREEERAIEHLQALKQGLLQDLLTGRVRVPVPATR